MYLVTLKVLVPLAVLAAILVCVSRHHEQAERSRHLNQQQKAMIQSLHTAVPNAQTEIK